MLKTNAFWLLPSWESCCVSFHFWDGEVIYSGNGLLLLSLECAWGGEVLCLHLGQGVPAVMLEPGWHVSMRDVKQLFGLGLFLIWEWRDDVITALTCACCWNSESKTCVLFPAIIGKKEVVDVCGRFLFVVGDGDYETTVTLRLKVHFDRKWVKNLLFLRRILFRQYLVGPILLQRRLKTKLLPSISNSHESSFLEKLYVKFNISSHVSHISFDCNILVIIPPLPSVSCHDYTDQFSACFVVLAIRQVMQNGTHLVFKGMHKH